MIAHMGMSDCVRVASFCAQRRSCALCCITRATVATMLDMIQRLVGVSCNGVEERDATPCVRTTTWVPNVPTRLREVHDTWDFVHRLKTRPT